jgi:hypothetical protein
MSVSRTTASTGSEFDMPMPAAPENVPEPGSPYCWGGGGEFLASSAFWLRSTPFMASALF